MTATNLKVGKVLIAPGSDKNVIMTWGGQKGSYCKLMPDGKNGYTPVTHPQFTGSGLVVFVDRKLERGEALKITKINGTSATADIVFPTRIILCNNSMQAFGAIEDRLEMMELVEDVVYLQYGDEAVRAIPEKGKCMIVIDSTIINPDVELFKPFNTQGVTAVAIECKKKNPQCQIVLHAGDNFDLDLTLFDKVLPLGEERSYDKLFEIFQEYFKK